MAEEETETQESICEELPNDIDEKFRLRQESNELVAAFLAGGGSITVVPMNVTGKVKKQHDASPKKGRPRSPGGLTERLEADAASQ